MILECQNITNLESLQNQLTPILSQAASHKMEHLLHIRENAQGMFDHIISRVPKAKSFVNDPVR